MEVVGEIHSVMEEDDQALVVYAKDSWLQPKGTITIQTETGEQMLHIAGLSDQRASNLQSKSSYYSFALFIYGFLVIIAAIAVLIIINSMNNSISNQLNKYGMMKATGMSDRQLRRMVLVEAAPIQPVVVSWACSSACRFTGAYTR